MIKYLYKFYYFIKKFFQNNKTSINVHNIAWKKEGLLADHNLEEYIKRIKKERNQILNNQNVKFDDLLNTLKLNIDKYTIIDLGSGTGDFILTAGERFSKIISVEPGLDGIKTQKKLFKNLKNIIYYNQTAEDFLTNYEPKGPHIIFLFSVLMHIKTNQIKLILQKLNKFPSETILVINEIYTNKEKNVESFMNYAPTKKFFKDILNNYNLLFMDAKTPQKGVFKGIRGYKKN